MSACHSGRRPRARLQRGFDVALIDRVLQCRTAVGVIRAQKRGELGGRRVAVQLRRRRRDERAEVPAVPCSRLGRQPARLELLGSECAHQLEH
jgi:hypothetical protein